MPDAPPSPHRLDRRVRIVAIVAALLLSAVIPVGVWAAARPVRAPQPQAALLTQTPIPLQVDLGVSARRTGARVTVTWRPTDAAGGRVFYHVFRAPDAAAAVLCSSRIGGSADRCWLQLSDLGTTRSPRFVDASPPSGSNAYFVGVAANWLDDPAEGDVYVLSTPVTVK